MRYYVTTLKHIHLNENYVPSEYIEATLKCCIHGIDDRLHGENGMLMTGFKLYMHALYARLFILFNIKFCIMSVVHKEDSQKEKLLLNSTLYAVF